MARGRQPARMPGLGRFGPMLVVAALVAAACSSGNTAPAEPPAPVEPAEPSTTSVPPPDMPPEPVPDPAPRAAPSGTSESEADANSAAPADGAEGDPSDVQDPVETAPPAGLSAGMEAGLRALLDELAEIAGAWSPAGRAAVAVATPDGKLYGLNEHRQHISASAVKPIWVAAAIDLAGLDAVAPLAEEALVRSDNFAAGEIIDLVGIDTVNDWSTDVAGSTGTHLAAWYFGTDRVAQSVTAGGTRANFTTVADLALFYALLRRGELVDPDGVAALEGWLRATARGSTAPGAVNGALLARLPEEVALPRRSTRRAGCRRTAAGATCDSSSMRGPFPCPTAAGSPSPPSATAARPTTCRWIGWNWRPAGSTCCWPATHRMPASSPETARRGPSCGSRRRSRKNLTTRRPPPTPRRSIGHQGLKSPRGTAARVPRRRPPKGPNPLDRTVTRRSPTARSHRRESSEPVPGAEEPAAEPAEAEPATGESESPSGGDSSG